MKVLYADVTQLHVPHLTIPLPVPRTRGGEGAEGQKEIITIIGKEGVLNRGGDSSEALLQ